MQVNEIDPMDNDYNAFISIKNNVWEFIKIELKSWNIIYVVILYLTAGAHMVSCYVYFHWCGIK